MIFRRILAISLFFLGACTAESSPAPGVERPSEAGKGEVRAKIHLVDGAARVQAANGYAFNARPGIPLLAGDKVMPGDKGFVVLRLQNDYLVRIDSGVELEVSDIVLLGAPKAKLSLAAQLDRMLTRKEKRKGERIAGWHARLTGAETVPTSSKKKRSLRRKKAVHKHRALQEVRSMEAEEVAVPMKATKREDVKRGEAREKVERKLQKDVAEKGVKPPAAPPGGGVPSATGAEEVTADADTDGAPLVPSRPVFKWRTRVGDKTAEKNEPLPVLADRMRRDPLVLESLNKELAMLGVELETVEIMVELANHRIKRVLLGGGLLTPETIKARYVNKKMPGGPADGWVIFEVALP